jgi:LEA14-like dessication related protein
MPTVESIDREWGAVTNETTAIDTRAVVRNPNPVGIPGVMSVEFTARMNDVVLTEGRRGGIGLSTGKNTINLSSEIPNDRIATWWVTHVNGGESSTLTIDPVVRGPLFYRNLPNRTSEFSTDLLAPLQTTDERTLGFGDRPFLVVENQTATWGEATNETTPLRVSARIRNAHDYDVTLAGVAYEVTMNGVTLGNGSTSDGFRVAPGETGTLTVDAALDTQQFATWWPTHVRNDETSRMAVEMYGLVERNGTVERIPLRLYQERLQFETAILDGGGTTVEPLPVPGRDPVSIPTIEGTDSRWGAVTDATTDVETTVSLSNTSGLSQFRDLVRVRVDRRVAINDVTVANTSSTIDRIPDDGQLTTTTALANDRVPAWWARHVNNGESSTIVVGSDAVIDVGFTRLGLETPDDRQTFTTDILGDLETAEGGPIVVEDRTVLQSGGMTAEWGEATPERAPLTVRTTMSNEVRVPVEVSDIDYEVSINGITLADDVAPETYTIQPGQPREIALDVVLDNAKMDEWWVSHVRNGQRSELSVDATATVSFAGRTETVPLESLSRNTTITTDIFE